MTPAARLAELTLRLSPDDLEALVADAERCLDARVERARAVGDLPDCADDPLTAGIRNRLRDTVRELPTASIGFLLELLPTEVRRRDAVVTYEAGHRGGAGS